jgi:hypothetical protein
MTPSVYCKLNLSALLKTGNIQFLFLQQMMDVVENYETGSHEVTVMVTLSKLRSGSCRCFRNLHIWQHGISSTRMEQMPTGT